MIPNPSATQYDWPLYASQHLFGEPDCTYVPQGYPFDFTIDPDEGHWLWLGMIDRMYGGESLNAHCN
jgi:hypothetical protein